MKLAHINKSGTWPSGNPRLYFRPKGQRGVALPDLPPDHPEFLAAYVKAAGLTRPPTPDRRTGTIGAAIRAFMASDAYLSLAQSTRRRWRPCLDIMDEKYGHVSFASLEPKHIRADMAGMNPHPANDRLKVWRALCRWSEEAGLIEANPALQIKKRKVPQTGGHRPWTREDVAIFRQHWPTTTPERMALELLFWTGVRISDAVRLNAGMLDASGWLEFRQQKTGGQVVVPFYAPAPDFAEPDEHLQNAIRANPQGQLLFIVTQSGTARSAGGASKWFAAATRKAGVVGKTAHGLRKLRATIMAENGASPHQIGAWTGHESLAEVQHYASKANKRKIISGTKSSNFSEPVPTFDPNVL